MSKLSKANLLTSPSPTRTLRDTAPVIGMAALWVSLFKQLLYPALYAYYRTGHDGAITAQVMFSIALVACTFALLIAHARLGWLLNRGRWAVALVGSLGALGIALRAFGDFSTDAGAVGIYIGSALSAFYLPVHFTFWALYARRRHVFGAVRLAVLSFLLFLGFYLLLTIAGINSIYVSVTCPLISALMALATPRATSINQAGRAEAGTDALANRTGSDAVAPATPGGASAPPLAADATPYLDQNAEDMAVNSSFRAQRGISNDPDWEAPSPSAQDDEHGRFAVHHAPREVMDNSDSVILRPEAEELSQLGTPEIPRSARNDGSGRFIHHAPSVQTSADHVVGSVPSHVPTRNFAPVSAPAHDSGTPAELPLGFAEQFDLSEREAEVAVYAHRNYSARKIAGELFIAESTVYTHLKRIYRKTGVHSKHDLIDLIDSWH